MYPKATGHEETEEARRGQPRTPAGYEVHDPLGRKIGTAERVFANRDNEPEYVGVKIGFFGPGTSRFRDGSLGARWRCCSRRCAWAAGERGGPGRFRRPEDPDDGKATERSKDGGFPEQGALGDRRLPGRGPGGPSGGRPVRRDGRGTARGARLAAPLARGARRLGAWLPRGRLQVGAPGAPG